ncbi:GNAT family N-acetyltransferase [Sphingomonas sp. Leaf339]|uniref:GNAT family N-acetyltransferase n=1 Tax=Sphingomonas sp. Leaf339 TaxID=1736343 RepID=UPI000AA613BA|nr:GNAT family N-acetyltransferase [Sphingomonas sp. Leaf339]
MFARTERLTLRPAWPEDAPALAGAIGDERVVRMLSRVPYPYTTQDADCWVAQPRGPHEPRFVIEAHDRGAPALIGGIGISEYEGRPELGYWLTPDAWGRGYATEAGRVVIEMARHALPIDRLDAWHFADNPASGRVLRKLGFRPTGTTIVRQSAGRREQAACVEYTLDLAEDDRVPMPIAA